jgi:hypothetical protein
MSEADAVRRAVRAVEPEAADWTDEDCEKFLAELEAAEDELEEVEGDGDDDGDDEDDEDGDDDGDDEDDEDGDDDG